MQLTVHVQTLGRKAGLITVSENDLVEKFYQQLEYTYGIPAKQQRVLYEGRDGLVDDLKPGRRLKDYALAKPARVILGKQLPPKPKGPAPDFSHWRKAKTRRVRRLPPCPSFPPPQDRGSAVPEVPSSPAPPNRPLPRANGSEGKSGKAAPKCTALAPRPALSPSLSWSPPITGTGTPKVPAAPEPTARARAATPGAPAVNIPGAQSGNGGVARIRRCDLQRVGRLGVGAFGLVTLEADRRNGRTYALKAVSKGYLAHLRMEYSVLNEKRILKMLDTPFVVRLLATYNGREHVYFLLEAALGGELFTTYERLKLYGSEHHARFYVACVTEALTHLHEKNVIYRDLKPENLLLDVHGFCKVTDMGLAKISSCPTFTMVGTPDYMAPEVIDQTGHTKSVDWWTLGVLLFELLSGHAPFESKSGNAHETYGLVKRGIETVRFPEAVKPEAGALVRNLCHRNPEVRLRTPVLREHGFFRRFDWPGLQQLRMAPPLVPQVRGPRDLTNFRDCEHEDPQDMPYQDTGSGWDIGFEDDILSSGASAAAAAAPMLSLPTPGASASAASTPTRVPAGSPQAYRPVPIAAQVAPRTSPPCSPRRAAPRYQATTSARGPWQAQAQAHDRKVAAGSFMPRAQSPPTSPVLGGG